MSEREIFRALSGNQNWKPMSAIRLVAGIILGSALVVGLSACKDKKDEKAAANGAASAAPQPALTVSLVSPTTASSEVGITANGSIAAWQDAVVGAEAAGLRITDLHVNVGDHVKKGQLLASLSPTTVEADLAATRAALAEAEAARMEAKANADRARLLDKSGAISAQQVNQYLTAEKTAQARYQAQQARLKVDQVRLSQTRVIAPDDGVISMRTATVGSVVQPGQELFRLIRGGRLEWRAEVTSSDLAQIKPGQAVTVQPADGIQVSGKVRVVAPTIDPNTRNGLVYVDLERNDTVRAGMFAKGSFSVGASSALTLPQSAVALRDGFDYVFMVNPQGRVTQTKVTVGRRTGNRIEILKGLTTKDQVVASGVGFLTDGDLVRVANVPASTSVSTASVDSVASAASAKE